MKKINSLVLLGLLASNLFAINLDEVLNISLEKNLDISSKTYDYQSSKENFSQNKSGFLPKVDLSYSFNDRDKIIGTQTKQDSTASAIVSYNLFNGLKNIASLNSSKYLKNESMYLLNATKQDILLKTKTAYINLLNSRKNLETKLDAYKLFEKQYIDAKNQFEQGIVSKNDLLKVQINMLDSKQNVVLAKSEVKISKYELSNILGGYDLSNENIEEINEVEFTNIDSSIEDLKNRSEIKALEMSLKSFKEESRASKSAYYPKVDASFAYNEYSDNESIGNIDNQEVVNVTASWNIYNGASDYSEIIKRNIAIKKAKISLEKLKLDIKLQYENALAKLEVARLNYDTSKLALQQAQENYKITENRFKEGLSDNTDLIDANYLLTSAKQRYSKSYYDKYLAIATLQRVIEQ